MSALFLLLAPLARNGRGRQCIYMSDLSFSRLVKYRFRSVSLALITVMALGAFSLTVSAQVRAEPEGSAVPESQEDRPQEDRPPVPRPQIPEADVPPEDRLDDLEAFDPDELDEGMLEEEIQDGRRPPTDETDPNDRDEGLQELLQNFPDRSLGDKSSEALEGINTVDEKAQAAAKEREKYSKLSFKAEKNARLEALFERLKAEENAVDANLIAEEIWALWLNSGSATVDFLVRRGTAAQKNGETAIARQMYDHVTSLLPDYAEGWSRSARLAIDEEDLSRALVDVAEALRREPRHFYALWTMGNVLERLGRQDAALEAYREANRLYPELDAVKERVDMMRNSVEGSVL